MQNKLPKEVTIIEVGPRDGLQNEKSILSVADKLQFIELLVASGFKTIEATSFVRADRIPQMGDADKLFAGLDLSKANFPCLVPNEKGMENALKAGVKEIAVFTATSNTFNQKNTNATVDESLKRLEVVARIATREKIKIRGYISTVFGCPYEGSTSVDVLMAVAKELKQMGCYDISLGDTIGVANPLQVKSILSRLENDFSLDLFSMHFHDTRGLALANVVASLEMGVSRFDSSAGGLGGCPYAKGATGNVASEDVINLCESMGIKTNIDMDKLIIASDFILGKLNKTSPSKYYHAHKAK